MMCTCNVTIEKKETHLSCFSVVVAVGEWRGGQSSLLSCFSVVVAVGEWRGGQSSLRLQSVQRVRGVPGR